MRRSGQGAPLGSRGKTALRLVSGSVRRDLIPDPGPTPGEWGLDDDAVERIWRGETADLDRAWDQVETARERLWTGWLIFGLAVCLAGLIFVVSWAQVTQAERRLSEQVRESPVGVQAR